MTTLITGAANGLGQQIGIALNKLGHELVLMDKDETALVKFCGTLRRVTYFVADITKEDEIKAISEKLKEQKISLDNIINNAGVAYYHNLVDMPASEFKKQLDVNILGSFLITKHFVPELIAKKSGSVINIGSRMAYLFEAERSGYCASKFGLRGMSLCFSEEAKEHQVKVTVIEPDSILTNFNNDLQNKLDRQKKGEAFLNPEEVAQFVANLIAGEVDWHTEFKLLAKPSGMEIVGEDLDSI